MTTKAGDLFALFLATSRAFCVYLCANQSTSQVALKFCAKDKVHQGKTIITFPTRLSARVYNEH